MGVKIRKIVAAALIIVFILAVAASAVYFLFTLSTPTLRLTGETAQTIEGFGVTGAWWAQELDDPEFRSKIVDALFTDEGLNLNIYRYNVGGGEGDILDSEITTNRATESFLVYDPETRSYKYDFSRDANAYAVLTEALSPGHTVEQVILFANSPHYSMTVSGSAIGQKQTHLLNLRQDAFYDYADYLVTIAEHFVAAGVPVSYISPINEPQWSWGGPDAVQEGCHYEPEDVATLAEVLYYRMLDSSLPSAGVKMSLFESGSVVTADFEPYLKALAAKPHVMNAIDHMAVHSYHLDGKIKLREIGYDLIKEYAAGKKVHMSEWCELPCAHNPDEIGGALVTSRTISNDLNYLNAVTWEAWKAFENIVQSNVAQPVVITPENVRTGIIDGWGNDALLYGSTETGELYFAKRYYALQHYSKFVVPGSVRLECRTGFTSAAFERLREYTMPVSAFRTPDGKTVVVITNTTGVERVLKAGDFAGKNVSVYRTDRDKNMQSVFVGQTPNKLSIPAESITTYVFE